MCMCIDKYVSSKTILFSKYLASASILTVSHLFFCYVLECICLHTRVVLNIKVSSNTFFPHIYQVQDTYLKSYFKLCMISIPFFQCKIVPLKDFKWSGYPMDIRSITLSMYYILELDNSLSTAVFTLRIMQA